MLTLITGEPGAGKTALAVSLLMEEVGNRPLFVMGIPELKISHQPTPPIAEWTEQVALPEDPTLTRPVFTFPPNAIIVIDEAQNVYRPRSAASKVPDIVAAFETHRHTGVDFWLITQGPHLIDSNIKSLIGRHLHIRNMALGRQLYEWSECGDPKSKASRDVAARKRYTLPKKAFEQYKSASLHLKQSKRIPGYVWLLGAALVAMLALGWLSFRSISNKMDPDAGKPAPANAQASPDAAPALPTATATPQAAVTAASLFEAENPRLAGRPETAPAYDQMRQVRQMPQAVAFIANRHTCHAYTQQGTRIQMTEAQCREEMNAPRFNPYVEVAREAPAPVAKAEAMPTQREQGGSIQMLGDSSHKPNMFDRHRQDSPAEKRQEDRS
ncbi:zonular occludens toxin domain-containing protein [Chromobacterium sp. TRC.1.1.SA]|uniref:Zonular occludens toxin domain-containing protein n=1 Tax=Chromobacterium indicum TaxID=3110228 RepID=A0ABV0CUB8_9NEIS